MIDIPHVTRDNCRVGDRVYSYRNDDWGNITMVDNFTSMLPIEVNLHNSGLAYFTEDGKSSPKDSNPDLFYSVPVITANGPPKRIGKQTWYMGVGKKSETSKLFKTTFIYQTIDEIKNVIQHMPNDWKIIPIEVEVEE